MTSRRLITFGALAALVTSGTVTLGQQATAKATPESSLVLYAPRHATVYAFRKQVFFDVPVSLEAIGENFELWSHRTSYDKPITTELRRGSTVTELPAGLMDDFTGLSRFFDVTVQNKQGDIVLNRHPTECLTGDSQRVEPDGAPHSTYPWGCPDNIFTRGSVQGIAAGWATSTPLFGYRSVRLPLGRYTMSVTIAATYRAAFGISDRDATRTVALKVRKIRQGGPGPGPIPLPIRKPSTDVPHGSVARLAPADELSSPPGSGPDPDLEAVPAWGIRISKGGNYLQFSATVWNGGDSPLVVQGFRSGKRGVMDAYQYFYDSAGNQTGYVPAGQMIWDPRKTHHHWHFEDFARYRLLDANKHGVARSKKEAFCLANTDMIDYTVPGANWNPDDTDLATSCGDEDSPAVSEVLASGSGDTYAQFRAGQSFSLKGLKNGTYYVSVEANPNSVLTEQSRTNNTALRKVRIGGKSGHRTVYVYPVGGITG
ncbi:MAG TPA: lysyl oxidase family protein [Jatrophihabitantaceae bacterium]|jgi:hypothetical protein|nr:lysyl oxidase family protein [Jatrophihabitantaceae bacterium]